MKKYFFSIAIIASVAFGCRAQDTVRYGDPYYFFEEMLYYQDSATIGWPMSVLFLLPGYPNDTGYYTTGYLDYAMRYNTPTPEEMLVYGVAITPYLRNKSIDKYDFELFLAQIRNDSIFFVDSTRWKPSDHQAWFEYIVPFCGRTYDSVVPVYELYFDTPQSIRDTFCVGYKGELMSLYHTLDSSATYFILDPHEYTSNCSAHLDSIWCADHQNQWWGGIFPIIEYRHPCETPSAPRPIVYAATNPNLVQFQLPYSAGDSMWLSIAEYGQPADSGIIYNVTDSVMDIVVPDSGYYTARLRSFCSRYDIPLQSAWSAPANFLIIANLDIQHPDDRQASMLRLYPNPTGDEVTVSAEDVEGEAAVSVVDMAGVEVYRHEGIRLPLTLGTAAWSTGTYLVRLTTPQGVATKKLTVSR